MRRVLLIVLVGCGRYGFGEIQTAATTDGSSDATVVLPDGIDGDAAALCAQPAPFLQLIDTVVNGNQSTHTARYCYAELAGPITAQMRREDDSIFVENTGPIELAMIDLLIGGADCPRCFIRLIANGIVEDGPLTDFIGD